ncbi:MAG: nucleotidyltransferase family protein [Pseudomonadota bacterium]
MKTPSGQPIAGLLLAAGRSTRFGGDKLLHPLGDGVPIAVTAARVLRAATDQSLAIVRPDNLPLRRLLEAEDLRVITCTSTHPGLGASIAQAVAASGECAGWLIALADMPYIRLETARAVSALLREGSAIVAPYHYGKRGHPIGFNYGLREELLALRGDKGAGLLLDRHAGLVTRYECDDPGISMDIDAPADIR